MGTASAQTSISIHSLRVEGDTTSKRLHHDALNFNPLPPCGGRQTIIWSLRCGRNFNPLPPCGGRPKQLHAKSPLLKFQSTPSVWRETMSSQTMYSSGSISIHSLRVEGDTVPLQQHKLFCISIHSLRVEGDPIKTSKRRMMLFQSTPSVWRETVQKADEGGADHDFNPLPPCGGRPTAKPVA